MDELLAPLQDAFEAQIDFQGQKIADSLCTALITLSGAIAFITGYISKDVFLTVWVGLAGTILTAFVVIPPWPFYNKHPEPWLGVGWRTWDGGPGIAVDGVKVG
ncbi:hypothetical protein AJ80_02732 [Polytolypa hystricis UAMH7299]|uniref:Signal peptidase complex subunit 1 n=1 Tax=Polytolypa hystricis (strain UAMH7299) TaxID=1447883 RepID=A0A2B7YQR4_POLH7|nr:hypothetical protein AJ80_02732 [Polytolypa hystricis UAMH7299]